MPYGSITDLVSGRYNINVTVPITGGSVGSVAINLPIQNNGESEAEDYDKAVQALLDALSGAFTVNNAYKYYSGNQPITAD